MVIPLLAKCLTFIFSVHQETLEVILDRAEKDEAVIDSTKNYQLFD